MQSKILRVFFGKWTLKKCNNTKLVLLLMDDVPASEFSYYMKWGYFIAECASSRYGIQSSGSDITVQHLAEYYAHRGGKGNLGKEKTAVHCVIISKAHKGQKKGKRSAEHCAKKQGDKGNEVFCHISCKIKCNFL